MDPASGPGDQGLICTGNLYTDIIVPVTKKDSYRIAGTSAAVHTAGGAAGLDGAATSVPKSLLRTSLACRPIPILKQQNLKAS